MKFLYSCQISMKFEFFRQILEKNPQISNFLKILSVGAEWFHADGRTDRERDRRDVTKLIVAFLNFVNTPGNLFHDAFYPVGTADLFQAVKQMEA